MPSLFGLQKLSDAVAGAALGHEPRQDRPGRAFPRCHGVMGVWPPSSRSATALSGRGLCDEGAQAGPARFWPHASRRAARGSGAWCSLQVERYTKGAARTGRSAHGSSACHRSGLHEERRRAPGRVVAGLRLHLRQRHARELPCQGCAGDARYRTALNAPGVPGYEAQPCRRQPCGPAASRARMPRRTSRRMSPRCLRGTRERR